MNPYRYCGNNPVARIDPSGLCSNGATSTRQPSLVDMIVSSACIGMANPFAGLEIAGISSYQDYGFGSMSVAGHGSDFVSPFSAAALSGSALAFTAGMSDLPDSSCAFGRAVYRNGSDQRGEDRCECQRPNHLEWASR